MLSLADYRRTLKIVISEVYCSVKKTFDYNFDLYQAFKQHGYTNKWKQREAVN